MNIETAIISSIGSFLIGIGIPLAFVYPKITNLETRMGNVADSVQRIEEGKVYIVCPRHTEITERLDKLEARG